MTHSLRTRVVYNVWKAHREENLTLSKLTVIFTKTNSGFYTASPSEQKIGVNCSECLCQCCRSDALEAVEL